MRQDFRPTAGQLLLLPNFCRPEFGAAMPDRQILMMEARRHRGPIRHWLHKAMFDRVVMNIVTVNVEIPLIANCMFPEPPAPDARRR